MKLRVHKPAALSDIEVSEDTVTAHAHLNGYAAAPTHASVEASSPSTLSVAAASYPVVAEVSQLPATTTPAPVNGSKPAVVLKKLSNRHKNALSLVLQGKSREDAASVTGFTPQYITMLLQQPLAKEYIAYINRTLDVQLEGLYGKSVQALADGLNHQDPKVYLSAAKLQLQATGRFDKEPESGQTAEDVVKQILIGVQVNVNNQPR